MRITIDTSDQSTAVSSAALESTPTRAGGDEDGGGGPGQTTGESGASGQSDTGGPPEWLLAAVAASQAQADLDHAVAPAAPEAATDAEALGGGDAFPWSDGGAGPD